MDLVDALHAEEALCCFVGAGGKKSAMYALAERLDRAVVTATVRIPIFDEHVADVVTTETPRRAIEDATDWPIGVVPEREGEDRYRGYEPDELDALDDIDETLLVKADGARMRRFKAPGPNEPRIPRTADTVVAIASAHVIGEPLDDRLVHRVDRVADVAGIDPGDTLTPRVVSTVLTDERGGRKDVPSGARFVPMINMVDDDEDLEGARAIATNAIERRGVDRVVLTCLRDDAPVVEVIR